MRDVFDLADELGPAKVLHIHVPRVGLKAILVVDNVAAGPSIGGVRMAPDVSLTECARLARAMTLKNAMAGLPHGGGKSVIFADPKMPAAEKEELVRAFAGALRHEVQYIAGPDMGTNEQCMAWVHDEIGRSVGLPRELGGIPLDQLGATGWGLAHAVKAALPFCDLDLKGARVAVQGFGSVGYHAARFLAAEGAVIVGASDSRGTVYREKGLDVAALSQLKSEGRPVTDYRQGEASGPDDIIDVECDIWIPAARPDVITEQNAEHLQTRLVAQGANIPLTSGAEELLHQRGVLALPDFVANAGGVICAAMEYHGATQTAAFDAIAEKLTHNTTQVLKAATEERIPPRAAAVRIARERVRKAMATRRWGGMV
ncbi:Glu/Leu/Phe/Val dehydrogenase [Marinobacter pelagius]|uniref:Glu/Leu/Phe/Val family dehydrogenase n=1 Tax=Marinobacter sp. C7 TaxID=2951363 RepID=UPI001EEF9C37|nr:Glu/Leu/Phe/Val dehydrogenase [Marinobacter sp. C7]MCG7199924.1 Glu/Leu/Phe/Val dehydrogenase [Marinobacter sp. C7]